MFFETSKIEDIYGIIQEILKRENQIGKINHTWVIAISTSNDILTIEDLNQDENKVENTRLTPQKVFRIAIMKDAHGIIVVTYHTTGSLKPSKTDRDLTHQLIQAGDIIGIQIIDHLLVNEAHFFSFKENGLIAPPSKNGSNK